LIFTLAAAAAMAGLVVRTNYRPPRAAVRRTPPVAEPTAVADPGEPRSKGEVYSRAAGRAIGKGIRAYRGPKPPPPPPDGPTSPS
jgi:hypothetical protein